jgi:hypothetical protein
VRRAGLLVLVLASLSLTTAFAASFDVQAEDVSSFSTPVSISVPDTPPPVLYLVGADRRLEPTLSGGQHSLGLTAPEFLEWESAMLPAGRPVKGAIVELVVYTTGGSERASAAIYECPDVDASPISSCTLLAEAIDEPISNGPNVLTLATLASVETEVNPGQRLRLRVTATSGSFNVQWGQSPSTRDSRLEFSGP